MSYEQETMTKLVIYWALDPYEVKDRERLLRDVLDRQTRERTTKLPLSTVPEGDHEAT